LLLDALLADEMLLDADHDGLFVGEVEWLEAYDAVLVSFCVIDCLFDLVPGKLWDFEHLVQQQ